MANLGKKNGVYLARFRHRGKEYKKSLKTSDPKAAEGAMHRVKDVLHRLAIRAIAVPDGVDAGDFIISGGMLTEPVARASPRAIPTLDQAVTEYLDNLGHLAESNRYTIGVHLRNLKKKLTTKVAEPIDQVGYGDLERFVQARLKERSHTTVAKERVTVMQFFGWATARGFCTESPAKGLTTIKKEGSLYSTFRTVQEVEAIVARGGLTKGKEWAMWDWLYLTAAEISGLLDLVRERSTSDDSLILHALPAYTGMRRGELLRLRWIDVVFDHDSLTARSRKQSRQESETQRQIDLHPELKTILLDWQRKHPRGQYVLSDENGLKALTPNDANRKFWQPLRRTKWCLWSHGNRFKIGCNRSPDYVSRLGAGRPARWATRASCK
jgi:integrase